MILIILFMINYNKKNLQPSPEADKATLLRRVSLGYYRHAAHRKISHKNI